MRTVLVTGITGFVGCALSKQLQSTGWKIRGVARMSHPSRRHVPSTDIDIATIPSINGETNWKDALTDIDIIIHLAARTHVVHETLENSIEEYRLTNVEGTAQLARSAAASDVKRFIYLSSVKVNGEGRAKPYTERDTPAPKDGYGLSKWEAEQALRNISAETGLEVVIIRPPLVYGPGVKANFLQLLNIVKRGIPLPLSAVQNQRSLIYVGNLIDAIMTCIDHHDAAGKTYLVGDGEDISTPELLRKTAAFLGRSSRLFPFPSPLLRLMGKLIGKSAAVDRLLGSLTIDCSIIKQELRWRPPYTMDQGLKETAEWFSKQS